MTPREFESIARRSMSSHFRTESDTFPNGDEVFNNARKAFALVLSHTPAARWLKSLAIEVRKSLAHKPVVFRRSAS